jgi:hypothetical protein
VLWDGRADILRSAMVDEVPAVLTGGALDGPAVVAALWLKGTTSRSGATAHRLAALRDGFEGRTPSLVVLTNAAVDDAQPFVQALGRRWEPSPVVLGRAELSALLDTAPAVRRRVPSVLGVRELGPLLDEGARARSSWDEEAARELARMFVPTRAYRRTLETLERHRFAVLTGPPEMGKTAIARTVGLALATEGWQVHECIRPDQVRAAFDAERPQLFVADDAFGSTEYRPDAAERWALELDGILRRLDKRHWLIWTSRPAPLKAGLGRIHREHGVERFPDPTGVHVDASALDLEEKTLILFRHTRGADLRPAATEIVREYGEVIVEHEHFTPGRIGRFVQTRLPQLAVAGGEVRLRPAIEVEIAEPTAAMAASLRALPPEHRALLVAMVDQPPGPVSERALAATARRHAPAGLPRQPAELVDRLTDHFVRVIPPAAVTWVHPSWRDLVIDDLAADPTARRAFLQRCSLEGILLALSHGGGATGRRSLPLLVADADWDAAGERIYALVPELDEAELLRLLAALEVAGGAADARAAAELLALTAVALDRIGACWQRGTALPDALVLDKWLDLSARVPDAPPEAVLRHVWRAVVPEASTPDSLVDAERYVRWLRLTATLARRSPAVLREAAFPRGYRAQLDALCLVDPHAAAVRTSGSLRAALLEAVALVGALVEERSNDAYLLANALRVHEHAPGDAHEPQPGAWRWEPRPAGSSIVRRILADLG